ncbi:MAG: hypothetical protein P4L84_21705 [Isosphaeraceae bacterium]|nr:hypothetical protein [Isosphaeraceae bacterium]
MRAQHSLKLTLMRWLAPAVTSVALAAGCHSGPPSRSLASAEPGLSTSDSGTAVAATPPARTVTWVDRHPLFYKPRDYYESSGNNTIVKTAAATVVGIPVGIFGELKQIVVGAPSELR